MPPLSHWINQFLCFLLALILVVACSDRPLHNHIQQISDSSSSSVPMRVVKHVMGETQVPVHPQRVVTLDTGHLADALALGVQPIGSTAWYRTAHQTGLDPVEPYLRQHSQELTILGYGFTANQVSLEKLLLLKPDLILAVSSQKSIYGQLSNIAPTVLYDYPKGNEWKDSLKQVAEVLGKTQAAESLLQNYQQRIQDFKQKMGDRSANPQVSVIHPLKEGTRLMYRDSFGGSILQDADVLRPPAQDKEGFNSIPVSFELIPQMDGDAILSIFFEDQDSLKLAEQLQKHPLWSQLGAVQQGRVYPVDAEHWYGGDIITANLVLDDLFKYLIRE
jgi:iron complex transport system substrate-binding protein